MGRPIKSGLDYFPVDTTFDDTIELLQAECGIRAIGLLIKLWQKIYRNGYYLEWNEDIALLFSQQNGIQTSELNEFLKVCFRRKIFCEKLNKEYKILTSAGIQKRFLQISKGSKRTFIPFIKEYKLVNSEFTAIITEETSINSENSAQSKVKESKEKKSKELLEEKFNEFYALYPKKVDKPRALTAWNKIKLTDELFATILNALDKAKKTEQWTKQDGQFIPNPATWLNGERWNDELPEDEWETLRKKFEREEVANGKVKDT